MKNIIERLVVMSKNDLIDNDTFYSNILGIKKPSLSVDNPGHFVTSNETTDFKSNMENHEAHLIKEALQKCSTLQDTAGYLNITLSTLVRRKRKYKL